MPRKTASLKDLFPSTEQGYIDALQARDVLWWEYRDAYTVLKKNLPGLGIGPEYYQLRSAAELPLKKIKLLEKRIEQICSSLEYDPVQSILE